MVLYGPHAMHPTILVLQCYYVADVHSYPLSFWTSDISFTDENKVLLEWQGFSSNIIIKLFSQVYYHLVGLDRNVTNLSHICTEFAVRKFWYHSRLSHHRQELAWSKQILDKKYMCWVWNLLLLDLLLFSLHV